MNFQPTKRFSWSWSKLKNYRTCPKRHWEIDIQKNFKEESEALTWGNQVHDAMAKRIDKGMGLPPTMFRYNDWPINVMKLKNTIGVDVTVENKMAMDASFRPTSFFDAATWFRTVIDVKILIESAKTAITIDWKTGGNVNPEFEQLGLSAAVMFAHYPWLEQIGAIYVWLGHDTQTVKAYRRADIAPLWRQVMPEVQKMENAHKTLTYEANPSGLCVRHCPVTSCPYHGKGTR